MSLCDSCSCFSLVPRPHSRLFDVACYCKIEKKGEPGGMRLAVFSKLHHLITISASLYRNALQTLYGSSTLIYSWLWLICTSSMDSSLHPPVNTSDVDVAINTTSGPLPTNYIPGTFLPHSLCFGDITQQEIYYIILVSTQDQSPFHHNDRSWTTFMPSCLLSQSIIAVLTCPWSFFKFTTSKYLQLMTNTTRNFGKLREATKHVAM